jgi:squalene monooxygenase
MNLIANQDVVIVGAGFAGLSAGAALSQAGLQVTLLEAGAGTTASFRGELLHPGGVRTLVAIGLGDALWGAGAVRIRGFAAFGRPDEAVELPYVSGDGAGFEHAGLLAAFRSQVGGGNARLLTRTRVESLIFERGRVVGVRTDGGDEYRAPLIVAADGRHSKLRKLLGIPTQSTLLSYTVAPALEGDLLPIAGSGHVFVGAPGPILAYPYGHERIRMVIDIPLGVTHGRGSIAAYVREHYAAHVPPAIREGMIAALDRGAFASSANHAVSTDACAVPGAALVGDAGGCSHPLTATGMTTALHDIKTLVGSLRSHGLTDEALVAYQQQRYRFVRAREIFAHSLYDVLRGAGPGSRAMRNGVFRYWRADERARRVSMQILSGDDSSPTTFLAEYARVVAISGWQTGIGALRELDAKGAARQLPALLATAGSCLDVAVGKALSTVRLERRRALNPVAAATSH